MLNFGEVKSDLEALCFSWLTWLDLLGFYGKKSRDFCLVTDLHLLSQDVFLGKGQRNGFIYVKVK